MAKLSIHHATRAKAEAAGITLTIVPEENTIIALDTTTDCEYRGQNAPALLVEVLKDRDENAEPDENEFAGDSSGDVETVEGIEQEEDEEEVSGSRVKEQYKAAYEMTDLPGTCGDEMAKAFADYVLDDEGKLDLGRLIAVGHANGVDVEDRWGGRNPGMKRMNLGNVLRGKFRRFERVEIGAAVFQAEKTEEEQQIAA
jgi:hypothetical protein